MIGEIFGGFNGADRSAPLPPHHLLCLQSELEFHFDRRDPAGLRATLDAVAEAGQAEGDLQLSLRAQRMRAAVGDLPGSEEALGMVTDLYHEIKSRLGHLSWKKTASFS